MDSTGKAFIEHWDWLAEKGEMNKNTAGSLRTASLKVLGVLDNWENVDIREIDIENTTRKFQNLHARDFKPRTLNAYMRRFEQAVTYFLEYLENPAGWKPPTTQKRTASKSKTSNGQVSKSSNSPNNNSQSKRDASINKDNLVEYPYPLRKDLVVYLHLPADLKSLEVKRLTAFMSTLTVDFELDDFS